MSTVRYAACLLAVASLLTGCGGDPESDEIAILDPVVAVEDAASTTLSQPTTAIELAASTQGVGSFQAEGLVELSRGRFEVDVRTDPTSEDDDYLDAVIGTNGEGIERTYAVNEQGIPSQGRGFPAVEGPCWLNSFAPSGSFLGTISVEESARLAGAVVESLAKGEIAAARVDDGSRLLVRLPPSASRSRGEQEGADRRIWGARELLRELGGPIRVAVGEDGSLSEIEIQVERYRTYSSTPEEDVVTEGVIDVRLAATDQRLEIKRPDCQLIE